SSMDEDLRLHANLPGIPDAIRQVGIGGSMVEVRTDMDYLLPTLDPDLAGLSETLDALTRGLKLEQISYEELRDNIKNDLARLRRTPSMMPIKNGHYSSRFGQRRHPYSRKREFHHGLDISADTGTRVRVTADGKVVSTRFDRNLGLYIKIDHGNGFRTLYGHLRTFNVEPGQIVERGQVIGRSGNTGRSTAPHLHYEVRHYNQPQNPTNYF
ncbi:MAG: M23 family metallopeptidase, partial [Candidatus Neomarinimicrobiota bacterium]